MFNKGDGGRVGGGWGASSFCNLLNFGKSGGGGGGWGEGVQKLSSAEFAQRVLIVKLDYGILFCST